jgi:hypothetical protein
MYRYGANKIGWSANGNVRMSMEPGILRLGASMTATCSAGSYLLIEAADSAGICLSRTTAATGKYSFFTKGTGDFGFYDELNSRYCINIIKSSGVIETPLGLTVGVGTTVKNIRHGVSGAMVLGVVTVTDTGCTANTRYFFTQFTQGVITAPSAYWASTRTASTSFVITSNQLTETGTVHWLAIEP